MGVPLSLGSDPGISAVWCASRHTNYCTGCATYGTAAIEREQQGEEGPVCWCKMCVCFCLRVSRKWPPGSGYLCPALIREPVSYTARTAPGGPLCQSSRDLLMEMVSLGSPACLEGVVALVRTGSKGDGNGGWKPGYCKPGWEVGDVVCVREAGAKDLG